MIDMTDEQIKKMQKTMQMYDLVYGVTEPARQEFFLKAVKTMLVMEEEELQNKGKQITQKDFNQIKNSSLAILENNAVATTDNHKATKVYGENWIVIQNRLLHAISKLSVNERRLIMFLSPIVRLETAKNPKQRTFFVPAVDYANEFNISKKTVYRTLANVAKSMQHKPFFYWVWRKNHYNERGVAWFSECEYMKEQGGIEVVLDTTVLEMLTVFDKNNQFTKYQKEYIAKLGAYGLVLFELIASCMYQEHKQKTYTIEYLREKFDCKERYTIISEFKRNVLDKAIKDIEKHTSYRISYKQKKRGRIISEIVFSFGDDAEKNLKDNSVKKLTTSNNSSWQEKGLTDKQIAKIAHNLKEFVDANSNKIAQNDTRGYQEIFDSWKPLLKDSKTVNDFKMITELLEKVY